jgi:predicted PurR-regulated permease PerM
VYLFDAAYLQPKLFSKSIQAHPLEVFTIIIMAGSIGGVIGMMFAVPMYSLIRVISSTFLSHIEFFNTISKNIK